MKHLIIYSLRLLWATFMFFVATICNIITFIWEFKWENFYYNKEGEYFENVFVTWYEKGTWKSLYHWALKIPYKVGK